MMDQEGRESGGGGSRMELAKSKIKFPRGVRTWGSEAEEDRFLFQRPRTGRVLGRRSPQRLGKGRGVACHEWTHC